MKRHGVMIVGMVLSACGSLSADNSVQFLVQWNGWMDAGVLQESYELEFNVRVPAQTVEVKFPGASNYIPMEYDDEDQYFDLDPINTEFPTLSQLFAGLGLANGNCFIRIDKGLSTESVYRFSINTAAIIVDSFPGFATNIVPDEGQTVGPTVTFTWTNPEGYENFVGPWMGVEQGYSYYDGGMQTPGTTEWTCDPLVNGPATFEIGYAKVTDGIAGVMTYVSGKTIVWGLSEYSPTGWAPGKPLTALMSDQNTYFEVQSLPKARISFAYSRVHQTESADEYTYNAVVRVVIPNVWSVSLSLPSLPDEDNWMERISQDTLRIRFWYSSFEEMMAGFSSGTYRIRVVHESLPESVYRFDIDSSQIGSDLFPKFIDGVQPPRNSLVEIPTTVAWSLPVGYAGPILAVGVKEVNSDIQLLPPNTTSTTFESFNLGWNQVVITTMRTFDGVAGPMTYESGSEIDWDQTGSAPADWPSNVPYTYLGAEWMGSYYAILPGQCVFRLPGDLNGDCRVSLEDFAMMAGFWMMDCRGTQVSPDCWAFWW